MALDLYLHKQDHASGKQYQLPQLPLLQKKPADAVYSLHLLILSTTYPGPARQNLVVMIAWAFLMKEKMQMQQFCRNQFQAMMLLLTKNRCQIQVSISYFTKNEYKVLQ